MPYTPTTWADSPATSSPLDAANLNHLEGGVQTAQSTADSATTAAAAASAAASAAQTNAEAYADSTKIAKPTVAAGAEQYYAADASGNTIAQNYQLAYAEDLSGVATVIPTSGAAADIIGVTINVPATARNVSLTFSGAYQVTAAGAGSLYLAVYEITSGVAALIGSIGIGDSFLAGAGSAFGTFPPMEIPMGPFTTARQFKLSTQMIRDASSTLAASVRSTTTGNPKSFLKAVAE